MEPRVSLITLGVADLARARQFYVDGLGWPASSAGDDGVVFLRTGGAIISLFPRTELAADAGIAPEGSGFGGIALAHNVAAREDVDAALAAAAAAGGRIVKPAQEVFWGGYAGYFADPDGFLWEVAWNPHFPLGPDGTVQLPD